VSPLSKCLAQPTQQAISAHSPINSDLDAGQRHREMGNSVCDLALAADLTMDVFDKPDHVLFAVGQLDFLVQLRGGIPRRQLAPESFANFRHWGEERGVVLFQIV
jgi:hypothetical protein